MSLKSRSVLGLCLRRALSPAGQVSSPEAAEGVFPEDGMFLHLFLHLTPGNKLDLH